MAYAALASLQLTTHLVLNHDKCSIYDDERELITFIRQYVIFFISVLENSPQKANRLEGKIRDLANEAEDLIEYFMENQFRMNWSSVGLSSVDLENLKRVKEEIGSITGDLMDNELRDLPAATSSSRVAATAKNDVVIGLDEDLLAIKSRLCGESSKLEVIPIVGMGGIGKTTLARKAYDDPLVMEYFDIRVFVQASQDYCAKEFLSNLLASLKLFGGMSGEKNESGIAEISVYKTLKGRRYLIVMDDIWSSEALDDVRNIFPDDMNGSRIMLTTRLSDVAAYASSGTPLHEMKFMAENQSWKLLKQKVFTYGQSCPELDHIGKEIARGCRGLPLAVVLVAGILSTVDKTQASWEKIGKDVNSVFDGQLDKILSLSYTLLPHHLKPCFLFMGGFPEDYNIGVSKLIKLWVAEGFLRHDEHRCKSLEEEAMEYVEDLVKRSLVLVTSRKSNGEIKSCSLHDLVRDMCIRKAHKEKFLVLPEMAKEGRRISIGRSRLSKIWGQSPTIHTVLSLQTVLDWSLLAFLLKLRLLRVLDIMNDNSVSVPLEVFELFHLRYLHLAFTDIPAAISNLENLQTLIIRPYSRSRLFGLISYLPLEIWGMPSLRHLVLTKFHILPDPVYAPTLSLQDLQTLEGVPSCICSNRILAMFPNLKKLVTFDNSYGVINGLHNLANLRQLEKLKITTSLQFSWRWQYPAFPFSLKKMTLVGGGLPWKVMSICGSLPNLEVLKLKDDACEGTRWKTRDGEFPLLKFLLIKRSKLQHWITESNHFPRLKCLVLYECEYLTEIPDCIGEIPTLEVIKVDDLNRSLVRSAKQIQEDQLSYGNDVLQLQIKIRNTDWRLNRLISYDWPYVPLFGDMLEERYQASEEIAAIRSDWEIQRERERERGRVTNEKKKAWRFKNLKQTGLKSTRLTDKFMKRSNRAHTRYQYGPRNNWR